MRDKISAPPKERTTILLSKKLFERVSAYCNHAGVTQTAFTTRALINQLERESGDLKIRQEIEEEEENE